MAKELSELLSGKREFRFSFVNEYIFGFIELIMLCRTVSNALIIALSYSLKHLRSLGPGEFLNLWIP